MHVMRAYSFNSFANSFVQVILVSKMQILLTLEDPHENHRCVTGVSSQNIYLIIIINGICYDFKMFCLKDKVVL